MQIENSKNVVSGSIDANGPVAVGDGNHITYIINGNEYKIPGILSAKGASVPTDFLGRQDEIDDIRQKITSGNLLMLVNGEGGIGKTTLAAAYWDKYKDKYKHLAWLYCENGILETIRDNFIIPLGLSEQMKQYSQPEQQYQLIKNVLATLAFQKDCLLVLDNANREDHLHKFQDLFGGLDWHILITSRCHKILDNEYYVTHLPEPLARNLFKKFYDENTQEFENLLGRFLGAIGFNTLCIEIFSKNLREVCVLNENMESFLNHFEQKGLYLGENSFEISISYQQKKSATTDEFLDALYDLSKLDEKEKSLLIRLALIPAENHLLKFLVELFNPKNKQDFKRQLDNLAKKGWLFTDIKTYRISPVVQQIVLQKNRESLWQQAEELVNNLNDKLETSNGYLVNLSEIAAEPFVLVALSIIVNLNTENLELAVLYKNLAGFYETTGNLAQCLYWANRLQETASKIEDKGLLVQSFEQLGDTYTSLGDLVEALQFFIKGLQLSNELHRDDPYDVDFKNGLAISFSKLGEAHASLGNLEQALQFFDEYNRLKKELQNANPNDVNVKYGLALSYFKLGDVHYSLDNLEQALQFFEKYNGLTQELHKDYPDNVGFKDGLAISYSKLGDTHVLLGNLEQAFQFFEKELQISKELYKDHPNNVRFKHGLGVAYSRLGDKHTSLGNLEQALQFFEKELQISEELYKDHPNNVDFKNGLAASFWKLGAFQRENLYVVEKALFYFQQAETLWTELAAEAPVRADFQQFLAMVKEDLAEL